MKFLYAGSHRRGSTQNTEGTMCLIGQVVHFHKTELPSLHQEEFLLCPLISLGISSTTTIVAISEMIVKV